MSQSRVYEDEEILEMLRRCKEEHGVCSPRVFSSMGDDVCSPSLVMRRFGSWTEAKEEAGIDEDLRSEKTGRKQKYSDEQVLSHIRECYRREVTDDDGNTIHPAEKCTVEKLNACEDLIAPSVAIERFGGWIKAKEEAGIDPDERVTNAHPREFTDDEYLDLLRECEEKHGKVTQRLFGKDDDFPSAGAVRKRFADEDSEMGGWQIAKEKAGIDDKPRRYTDEELLEFLRECAEKHGSASASQFASDGDFCAPETVQRRFGGWNKAKEEAGLE